MDILDDEDIEFLKDLELFADVISDNSYHYAEKIKALYERICELELSK